MTKALPPHLRPDVRGFGRPYWDGAKEGKLLLPACPGCAAMSWPPRVQCPDCGSAMGWAPACGRGVVHTFTVVRQAADPFLNARVPYVVAMIDLEEGPRVMSNVIGCDVNAVHIGMAVSVTFVDAGEDLSLPMFAPA